MMKDSGHIAILSCAEAGWWRVQRASVLATGATRCAVGRPEVVLGQGQGSRPAPPLRITSSSRSRSDLENRDNRDNVASDILPVLLLQ